MALTEIDSFTLDHPGKDERTVRFLWGDLTQLAPEDAVDVLVVSCLPGDYTPPKDTGSLVEALSAAGVSVEDLAKDKAADYRPWLPCWISRPVTGGGAGIRFKRVLVFEPLDPRTCALDSTGAVFRALACFYGADPVSVAVPLVLSGHRRVDAKYALEAVAWAGAHYGSSNTATLTTVNVVARTEELGKELTPGFAGIKNDYADVFDLELPGKYSDYVDAAKAKVPHVSRPDSVTLRQAMAVFIYTTNYYYAINTTLRRYGFTDPEYRVMLPLVEAIDSGLSNMTVFDGSNCTRGENMCKGRLDDHLAGGPVTNTAFTSAAAGGDPWPGNVQTTFLGKGGTGAEVWPYSQHADEWEVLYHRDLTYRVDGYTHDEDLNQWNCDAHEVVTDWCGGPKHA
ncbi:hypothetical protein ABTX81_06640 [Kitasatospora sp. NPDC097605]|uniref:hypothetical protein n=1 Tax=Kitasatospora sp. NPDC097605 TaxID=3157226 RepID=UPI00331A6EF5